MLCQAAWKANLQLDADGFPHENRPPFALHFVLLLDRVPHSVFAEAAAGGGDIDVTIDVGRSAAAPR